MPINLTNRWEERVLWKTQLTKLIQKEIENFHNSIFKVELMTESLPAKKTAGPDGFLWEFYQTFKEEIILILHKLL